MSDMNTSIPGLLKYEFKELQTIGNVKRIQRETQGNRIWKSSVGKRYMPWA